VNITQPNTMPHSFDAEQSVLGGLMIASQQGDHDRIGGVLRTLKADSFYSAIHRTVFDAMRDLLRRNQPIDLVTLDACLTKSGDIERIGGFAYLVELQKNTPSAANIMAYARIVREHAVRRYALRKVTDAVELLTQQSTASLEDQMTAIQGLLSEVQEYGRTGKASGLRHIRDAAAAWLDEVEARVTNPQSNAGYSSGVAGLDELLFPKLIRRGSLVVIGARPKMGKTAFLLRILIHFAFQHKLPVGMFSLEMPTLELWERMVAQEARVNANKFYTGMSDADYGQVSEAMSRFIDSQFFVDDTPGIGLAHVQAEARKLKAAHGKVGCIAIDYLTLMKAEKADRNDLAYGAITKALKDLAKELDCPVFLLTQLNRQLESRTDKRPMPSDSRDTGQIEQDCDLWIGLYRDSVYHPDAPGLDGITEAIVRLNRHGKSGTAYLNLVNGAFYDADQSTIGELAMSAAKAATDPEDY